MTKQKPSLSGGHSWRRRESLRGAKVQQAGALTPRTDERRKAQRAPIGALKQRWRRRESHRRRARGSSMDRERQNLIAMSCRSDCRLQSGKGLPFGRPFHSGGAGNRTRVRKASNQPSFTCVAAISLTTELVNSVTTYPPVFLSACRRWPQRAPSLSGLRPSATKTVSRSDGFTVY